MESIVSDLAKSNLEKLINAILEQSRYICCFTSITGEFEKERKNLIAKKETLEEYVRVAKRRNDNILRDVTLWQKQAEDLIEEDTKTKVTCFFGRFPNYKWQYSRGKDLESKTEEIKRLMERNLDNFGITRDVPDIEYHSSQNYVSFKSRKLKFEELFNALTDVNNYMIGLQGMGGTGKTTLAKEMGKELKKSKCFDYVVDTTVSNTPDTKKIQDDIAGPLGLKFNDCTESERHKKLWDRLTNGEKILVILDDVWGDIRYEEIGIPFKDNRKGCKILVTTRNMNICHKMDKKIQLDILPEEEGWILFQKHAGLSHTSSKRILNKGRKISKECKGLPIAIAVIAASLKGKQRPEEWDVALQSLQNSMLERGDDENWSQIYTCLKYSYDNMKNETDKKLFLLCSVFREDEDISEEVFVRLAIGTGLIENIDEISNYGECRNKAIVAKYKLIDSCLLLHGEFGSVKMHDLVREVALSIANKEILAVDTSNKNEMTVVEKGKNIKYFLFEGKSTDLFSFKFDGSKLDLLIVYLNETENFDVKVPNSFFKNIAGLRVLYLSNKFAKATLSLPQSIQSLTNIRSLYLEGYILGDISILGILKGLQTLELVSCSMDEFPREISNLVKLKLLNLNYSTCERENSFKVIERCTSLEELYFIGRDISNIWHNVKLSNYQRFRILDMFYEFLMSDEFFQGNSLNIFMADEVFCDETFKSLLQKVECLSLRSLQGMWKNLIPEIIYIDDDGESNLVEIILNDIPQLKCLIDNTNYRVQNALSNLVALTLYEMENLKEICCGPLPFQLYEGMLFKSKISLCNLKKLSIRKCPMLTSLFELSTTQSLLLLEELEIHDCEQLKSIVKDENKRKEDSGEEIVDAHNHSKTFTLTFPNLKTLIIYKCPQLLFILPVVVARNVPKLVSMIIRECNLLKYVFGPYQHKHEEEDLHHESKDVIFTILSEVYLVDLPNFVDIYPECEEFKCLSVRISSSRYESKAQVESNPMKCKILHWIHKYRNKWRTTKIPLDSKDQLQDCSLSMVNDSSANDVIGQAMTVNLEKNALNYMPQTHVGSKSFFTLQNVTVLSIEECKKIEVIFCASMLEGLPYMHKLSIFRCNELKQIIGEDTKNKTKPFFPRLKYLVIVGCNKLKCVFPISTSKMLSELEVLVIVEACMLEQVFQGDTDLRAEIPNMKTLVFVELPRLCQEIEFFTVKDCCVKNCPKLSLSSSLQSFKDIINSITEISDVILILHQALHDKFYEDNQHEHDFESNELEDVVKQNEERIEEEQEIVEKASGLGIPSMAISPTDTALDKRQSLENEEEQMAIPSSNLNMEPAITKDVNYEAFHGTSNSVATQAKSTNPPGSKLRNQLIENTLQEMSNDVYEDSKGRVISNQNEMAKATEDFPIGNKVEVASGTELNSLQEIKRTCEEEGTTSKTIALSTDSESEHGEGQIFVPFSIVNIELETTKDVGVGDIQESSMSTVAPFDTTNSPEKLSHVSEDSSFACTTITKELEQLVCNKHLGLENLGLLSNFLVKHPCVGLMGNTVSDRYKGFAYTCLANLLKFLQSHSILDVLGSNQSEFIELLQDLRNLGFNKDWLDDLERLREL